MTITTLKSTDAAQHAATLRRLQRLSKAMDLAFRIPFTRIRFGADSILGLIPGAGDMIGLGISLYALSLAHKLGAPRGLMVKMLANSVIDAGLGTIPIIGDIFDMFFKSNTKNLKLLTDFLEKK
jgi:Domain of unknown function (DUF4112)